MSERRAGWSPVGLGSSFRPFAPERVPPNSPLRGGAAHLPFLSSPPLTPTLLRPCPEDPCSDISPGPGPSPQFMIILLTTSATSFLLCQVTESRILGTRPCAVRGTLPTTTQAYVSHFPLICLCEV